MTAPAGRAPGRARPQPASGSVASTAAAANGKAAAALAPQRRSAPLLQAFVLHQWDWSETSLILDLFTREAGRVAAVAKGAKRPYSQLRPVLMPFQRLQLGLGLGLGKAAGAGVAAGAADAGGEIHTLRSADYAGSGLVLPPARLMSGFYLNELLLKLLGRADPHAALFDAYAHTLQALAQQDEDEAPLRAFELVLLRQTGLLPALDRDTPTQAPLQSGRGYRLHAEAGVVAAAAGDAPAEALLHAGQCQALERALSLGASAAALDALRSACAVDLPALKAQLRPVLHYHLGQPVLRTRQLMVDVRRLVEPRPPFSPK